MIVEIVSEPDGSMTVVDIFSRKRLSPEEEARIFSLIPTVEKFSKGEGGGDQEKIFLCAPTA